MKTYEASWYDIDDRDDDAYEQQESDEEYVPEEQSKWHFITFGQSHTHTIQGKNINKDTVVMFKAVDAETGRRRAFELFGDQFCFEYHDQEWNPGSITFFSSGYTVLV